MKLRINRRTSFTQGEMKTMLGKIAHTCKIITAILCSSVRKMEIQMNTGSFSNFISKSDEVGPKYWEVLQTGTFHLKVPDFENRLVILSGIYRESLSNLLVKKFEKPLFSAIK